MECIKDVFPILLYVLGAILLIVLIILAIKMIKTLNKVDQVVDDISYKSSKLNGVFNIIDSTADAVSRVSDRMVTFISDGIMNLFQGRKKRKGEDDE